MQQKSSANSKKMEGIVPVVLLGQKTPDVVVRTFDNKLNETNRGIVTAVCGARYKNTSRRNCMDKETITTTDDPRIDEFWELFQADMDALGYTQEVEE